MRKLPVPEPWRLLFQNIREIETLSQTYSRLSECFEHIETHEIPLEFVESWSADQKTGRLKIATTDNKTITASFQIIGTHDGDYFLWGDANPSTENTSSASDARDALAFINPKIATNDRLDITVRDMQSLMALAAEALDTEKMFMPSNNGTVIAMFLSNITSEKTTPSTISRVQRLRNLFGKKRPHESIDPSANLFDFTATILTNQLDQITLSPKDLQNFELRFIDIQKAYDQGQYARTLELISDAKTDLGEHYQDQEPAGWLSYCEGACNLKQGDLQQAFESFETAKRAVSVPDIHLINLGLARSSANNELYTSNLMSVFIAKPQWFLENVTSDEKQRVQSELAGAELARKGVPNQVEAVLKAALIDQCEQEKRAFQYSLDAEKHREESHVLCNEDAQARRKMNKEYRSLLLKWFTLDRSADIASYGSDPNQNPSNMKSIKILNQNTQTATALAVFEGLFSGNDTYRYELVLKSLPLSKQSFWRIDKIWSVWDEEDIQIH